MTVAKRLGLIAKAGSDGGEFGYSTEVLQQIVSVGVGEVKMIPHPDGKGSSWVSRPDEHNFTVITRRLVKDSWLKPSIRILNEVLEMKSDGVYIDGRKL